jgi:hypothetical protein
MVKDGDVRPDTAYILLVGMKQNMFCTTFTSLRAYELTSLRAQFKI